MTPNDQILAYIRTYVPYAVGATAAWLLVTFAVTLPDELTIAITAFLVAAAQNVYYILIRVAETYAPWLGVFIGWPKTPGYLGLSDLWASIIRTGIPTIAGALLGLVVALGLQLDPQTQTGLVVVVVGLLQALYYAAARALVKKWPAVDWLLGAVPAPTGYLAG
jgi:hypothetical protein